MKNRKLLLIVSLVLAMTMSLGGTLAYLTDTDADVNVMTLGKASIVQNEQRRDETGTLVPFENNQPMLPAVYDELAYDDEKLEIGGKEYTVFTNGKGIENVLDKIVTVTNIGTVDVYVRTLFAFEDTGDICAKLHYKSNGKLLVFPEENGKCIQFTENDVTYTVGYYLYEEKLPVGATSEPSLMQIFWDKTATNETMEIAGEEYEIRVLSQAVQADGFTRAKSALDTAFGPVNPANAKTWFVDELPTAGSPGEDWPNNNPPVATKAATKDDVSAAIQKGDNVSLADDINDPVYPSGVTFDYTISEGQDIIFDLAGKTITDTNKLFKIENGGTLTLIDTVGGGKIYLDGAEQGGDRYGFAVEQGGTLNINGATIEVAKAQGDTPMAAMIYGEGGTVNLNSGKLIVHDTIAVWMLASGNNTPVFNMKGGEIALAPDTNDEYATGVGILGFGQDTGNLNLLGGKMTGKGIAYAPEQSDAKITVNVSDNFTNNVEAVAISE